MSNSYLYIHIDAYTFQHLVKYEQYTHYKLYNIKASQGLYGVSLIYVNM